MSFYNQVQGGTNELTHNKKVKLVAAAVADELNYVKASVSKMPQSEFKGKKYGKEYSVYLPDVGTVHEGLTASPDDIVEVEANIIRLRQSQKGDSEEIGLRERSA